MRLVRYYPNRPVQAWRPVSQETIENARWIPALDVVETEEAFIVKASLPGIAPEDLEITLVDGVLTLQGENKPDENIKGNDYRLRERALGAFHRRLQFRVPVDAEKVEAVSHHGVLTLTIPKAEEIRPKKISVRAK